MNGEFAMRPQVIGHRLFTDGASRPVYQDERGQFIEEDGVRIDGVWLVPEDDQADVPLIVADPNAPITVANL
jgi:hypothetical protein